MCRPRAPRSSSATVERSPASGITRCWPRVCACLILWEGSQATSASRRRGAWRAALLVAYLLAPIPLTPDGQLCPEQPHFMASPAFMENIPGCLSFLVLGKF